MFSSTFARSTVGNILILYIIFLKILDFCRFCLHKGSHAFGYLIVFTASVGWTKNPKVSDAVNGGKRLKALFRIRIKLEIYQNN
jgi:hypothetical protein